MVYVSDVVRSDMFGRRVLSLFDGIRLTDCLCTVCIFMYDILYWYVDCWCAYDAILRQIVGYG